MRRAGYNGRGASSSAEVLRVSTTSESSDVGSANEMDLTFIADAELRPLDGLEPGSGLDTIAAEDERVSTRAVSPSSAPGSGRTDLASTVISLDSALVFAAVDTLGWAGLDGRVAYAFT